MIGERSMFQDLRSKTRGCVTFGSNQKGKIARIGDIDKHLSHVLITTYLLKTNLSNQSVTILVCINSDKWVWNKKLGHTSLRLISKTRIHNLVRDLPSLMYKADLLCDVCQKGNQVTELFEFKTLPLELLHIDLFGPTKNCSMIGKCYGLVVFDDYFRWAWVIFLTHMDKSFKVLSIFCKRIQNEKVIIGVNSKMKGFKTFVKNMIFFIFFISKNIST
ncbi:hypothetical protein CR513_19762, partial [Mucuna pruriens]